MDATWLSQTLLFQGASGQEIREMLACLGARTQAFPKGSLLLHAGDRTRELGLVLEGCVHMEYHNFRGSRGRLLSYLSAQARQKGPCFSIPFDRQQLAAYLGVDRSALSHELSKMQPQGLLSCRKNIFQLHRLE